ncbi:hypothetical protein JCM5350_004267 [Sporobolomyces pararoseus]
MLRLTVLFAFVLAFATCVVSAPTPVVTAAPSVDLEERDSNNLEARAAKKKTTKKTTAKKSAPTQKLFVSTGSYSGKATYYYQDSLGSCGNWNGDNTLIVALNTPQVRSMGNKCGAWVNIKNTSNGKTVKAKIQDECPSCSSGSLDLSVAAFKALGSMDAGVLPISWSFA